MEEHAAQLAFAVFYGDWSACRADITEIRGAPDYPAIRAHLLRGRHSCAGQAALAAARRRLLRRPLGGSLGGRCSRNGRGRCATAPRSSARCTGIIPGWNGVLNVLLKSGRRTPSTWARPGHHQRRRHVQHRPGAAGNPDAAAPDRAIDRAMARNHGSMVRACVRAAESDWMLATPAAPPNTTSSSAVRRGDLDEVKRRTDPAPAPRAARRVAQEHQHAGQCCRPGAIDGTGRGR